MSKHPFRTLVEMARAAQRDDRQSTGALYGDLADRIEALEAEIKEWRMIVENLESQIKADRVTGATDLVDEAACLIWSELCPNTMMGDEDRPYYEAAAKAVIALTREAVIEECAKVCEGLRHVDYPSETSEWSSGTFDCAQAVRALRSRMGR